jgi:hypothetical protein
VDFAPLVQVHKAVGRSVRNRAESDRRYRRRFYGENSRMRFSDLSQLAAQLDGVSERSGDGLLDWRYRRRLIARQLDDSHIVIRASFDVRDFLLQSFPETFAVPKRFAKHMMVVADLENGNGDAIEDAVIAAWELQSGK